MPFRKSPSMDRAGVERLAEAWGKVVARRVDDESPNRTDISPPDLHQYIHTGKRP